MLRKLLSIVLASIPLASSAAADEQPPEPAAVVTASAGDGFSIASADGAFRLEITGYVQGDGRFFLGDEDDLGTSTFVVRRARPTFQGRLFRVAGFRFMLDFGNGAALVQDAHADFEPADFLRFRFGKFKSPFGLERLQSGSAIVFVERALPTALVPTRDVGAMVHGQLLGKRLGYQLAVLNGAPDGGSADTDLGDDKDLVGRLYARPFRGSGLGPLEELEIGVAASFGEESGDEDATGLPAFRTAGQLPFFRTRAGETLDETVVADGARRRLTAQGRWHWNRFGLWGELVRSSQEVRLDGDTATLDHQAWQVAASGLLTCDTASWEGVEPSAPFDPPAGGPGAVELAARIAQLDVDDDAFPTFANPDAAASRATAIAFGLTWYANAALKLVVNYERTSFEGGSAGGGDRPAEQVLMARVQTRY